VISRKSQSYEEDKMHYCNRGLYVEVIANKEVSYCWVPVAHAYNPSNSGGRDQEDHCSNPAQVNSSGDPISKKPITKKGWWSGSKCRL
jgi:hypothetical protein